MKKITIYHFLSLGCMCWLMASARCQQGRILLPMRVSGDLDAGLQRGSPVQGNRGQPDAVAYSSDEDNEREPGRAVRDEEKQASISDDEQGIGVDSCLLCFERLTEEDQKAFSCLQCGKNVCSICFREAVRQQHNRCPHCRHAPWETPYTLQRIKPVSPRLAQGMQPGLTFRGLCGYCRCPHYNQEVERYLGFDYGVDEDGRPERFFEPALLHFRLSCPGCDQKLMANGNVHYPFRILLYQCSYTIVQCDDGDISRYEGQARDEQIFEIPDLDITARIFLNPIENQ